MKKTNSKRSLPGNLRPGIRTRAQAALIVLVLFALMCPAGQSLAAQGEETAATRMIALPEARVQVRLSGDATYQVSLDGQRFSRELTQRRHIRLHNLSFDPLAEDPPAPPAFTGTREAGGDGLYLVQFVTQALASYQHRIRELGGRILVPFPDHALVVRMDVSTYQAVEKLDFVRWVGPFHAAYKLEEGLLETPADTARGLAPVSDQPRRYSILLCEKGESVQNRVADRIVHLGGQVDLMAGGRRMEATLGSDLLQEIASLPEVLFIDRWTPAENDMDLVRELNGADYLESVEGYTGQGVHGEVLDDGVRESHLDFQANLPLIHNSNSSDRDHGTSVYGILFGDGASAEKHASFTWPATRL